MNQVLSKRDQWIPWYFVLFFAFIVLVDGIMVWLAIQTHTGVVTDHAYEKGLAYNLLLEAEQKQELLGWQSDIQYEAGILTVMLSDKHHRIIIPDVIKAQFTRPSQSKLDFDMRLNPQATPVSFPAKGLWEVRIFATFNHQQYQHSKRLVIE